MRFGPGARWRPGRSNRGRWQRTRRARHRKLALGEWGPRSRHCPRQRNRSTRECRRCRSPVPSCPIRRSRCRFERPPVFRCSHNPHAEWLYCRQRIRPVRYIGRYSSPPRCRYRSRFAAGRVSHNCHKDPRRIGSRSDRLYMPLHRCRRTTLPNWSTRNLRRSCAHGSASRTFRRFALRHPTAPVHTAHSPRTRPTPTIPKSRIHLHTYDCERLARSSRRPDLPSPSRPRRR